MEDIEIIFHIEDRCIPADVSKGSTIVNVIREFEEICQGDEALTLRRLDFAPTFSMIQDGTKREIKRKYIFSGGEEVHVGWSPLKLQVTNLHCGFCQ